MRYVKAKNIHTDQILTFLTRLLTCIMSTGDSPPTNKRGSCEVVFVCLTNQIFKSPSASPLCIFVCFIRKRDLKKTGMSSWKVQSIQIRSPIYFFMKFMSTVTAFTPLSQPLIKLAQPEALSRPLVALSWLQLQSHGSTAIPKHLFASHGFNKHYHGLYWHYHSLYCHFHGHYYALTAFFGKLSASATRSLMASRTISVAMFELI
jgi:hypothetical protein